MRYFWDVVRLVAGLVRGRRERRDVKVKLKVRVDRYVVEYESRTRR